jgi:hypothetical protein
MITIPFISNAVLADKVIQTIASDFLTLGWMDNVYPVAEQGEEDDGKTYPMVYAQDGSWDYYRLLPDDTVKAFCFFVNTGFDVGDDSILSTYRYSLYVWCQLDKIQTTNTDFTLRLVADCLDLLEDNECFDKTVERRDPFADFTALDYHENGMMMRKRSGFRIDFSVYGDSNLCESNL